MKLTSSKELTKDELLTNLSSILDQWISGSSTKILIKDLRLCFVVDNEEYDLIKDGKEAEISLSKEVISNVSKENKQGREGTILKYFDLTEWMFSKNKELSIPYEIEKELEYVGETQYGLKNETIPVYSIESYCQKRGLKFIKGSNYDYDYVLKSIAAELISSDIIQSIETTAIHVGAQNISECISLKDLELSIGKPIYTDNKVDRKGSSLVTRSTISDIITQKNTIKPIGKLYRYFIGSARDCFKDVYDFKQIAEDHRLVVLDESEFNDKRYSEYLSLYDLNTFPKKMGVKENAIICGGRIDDRYCFDIKPVYKTVQVLKDKFKFIPEKDLVEGHFRCPIQYLSKLRKLVKKDNINYNELLPIGLTSKNDLVFVEIPPNIKDVMFQHIKLKEKEEEIKKIKAKESSLEQQM